MGIIKEKIALSPPFYGVGAVLLFVLDLVYREMG